MSTTSLRMLLRHWNNKKKRKWYGCIQFASIPFSSYLRKDTKQPEMPILYFILYIYQEGFDVYIQKCSGHTNTKGGPEL